MANTATGQLDDLYYVRAANRRRTQIKHGSILAAILAVSYWSALGTEFSVIKFIEGFDNAYDFLRRALPPSLENAHRILPRLTETIGIALLGTTFGIIMAFPLAFLASRNIVKSALICQAVRLVIDAFRGISEIVWAFLFVAAVGLGPFPGVLALAIHNAGALGKYFSETIEGIDPGIMEAVAAPGSNQIKLIARGIWPELRPLFVNYMFYYFEASVRAATILGVVGAGGIGLEFIIAIKHFKYPEAMTIVISMWLLVTITDRASAYVRRRLLGSDLQRG
ncbi:MAG: phosphonate ABC transporter, permease protein PhnE [Rhodospirillaceae bacterium]|nr:phosphonate ABC transporter, permease protein PhnE [Rhodospirillaceae bacterium]